MADNVPFRRLAPIIPPPEWYAEKEREGCAAFKAKVAALLREIEWSGEIPCEDGKSCPWCCATGHMEVGVHTEWQYVHDADCALFALLRECEA